MPKNHEAFPSRLNLWRGAILRTIAHAIWLAPNASLSHELSWDGPNYSRQNSMGTRGTITFLGNQVVGVFRDDSSPRAPWRSKSHYDLDTFLKGMPTDLLSIAHDHALKYVIDNYEGYIGPIVTAAFWSANDYLTAADDWKDVLVNGAHLIRIEIMEIETAIEELRNDYAFSTSQVKLLHSIFQHKTQRPAQSAILSKHERDVLVSNGMGGLAQSRELLAAIGIHLEKDMNDPN